MLLTLWLLIVLWQLLASVPDTMTLFWHIQTLLLTSSQREMRVNEDKSHAEGSQLELYFVDTWDVSANGASDLIDLSIKHWCSFHLAAVQSQNHRKDKERKSIFLFWRWSNISSNLDTDVTRMYTRQPDCQSASAVSILMDRNPLCCSTMSLWHGFFILTKLTLKCAWFGKVAVRNLNVFTVRFSDHFKASKSSDNVSWYAAKYIGIT